MLSLLVHLIHEPAFDQLRTQEQLGYVVSTSTRVAASAMELGIKVQSTRAPWFLEARVEAAVTFLTGQLGTSDFLVGEQLTLADIALCTALGIWRGALGRTPPDNLAAYRERLQARPAYQRAMQANT